MTEGWAAIPNWLVRDESVSAYAKLLYTVIQSHAGSTGTTRLLNSTIAREANVSPKTVERYLNELVALGVLYWVAQGGATRRTASVFHPLAEPDKALVKARHRPAKARAVKETVSPSGTVSETVLTQVNPQKSAVLVETVPSESLVGTVSESQAVPSEGRYVPSERRREEEPSKKNQPGSTTASGPTSTSSIPETYSHAYPGGGMPTPPPLPWYPDTETINLAKSAYPWATDVVLREVTAKFISWARKNGNGVERLKDETGRFSHVWLNTFLSRENDDREKAAREEAEASKPRQRPKNPMLDVDW